MKVINKNTTLVYEISWWIQWPVQNPIGQLFNDKKIPSVSPLRYQNNYVKAFNKKSELFNSLFAEQCSLIN